MGVAHLKPLDKFEEIPKYREFREAVEKRRSEGTLRYVLVYGGRGSGKSKANAEILTRFMFANRDRIVCFRKNEAQNKDSIYMEIVNHLKCHRADGVKITPRSYHVSKSPKKIATRHRNGRVGSMDFHGLRFSDRIKSIFKPDVSVFEEATEFTKEDFLTYDLSVRHDGAIMFMIFNPPHEGEDSWLYQYFLSEKADPDVKSLTMTLHTNYMDNPYISDHAKRVYESLKDSNPYEYRRSILGEFLKNEEGLVYTFIREVDSSFKPAVQAIRYQGLDFGHTDPTAMLRLYYWKENGKYFVYIEKEKYKSGLDTQSMINYISEWVGVKKAITHADSSHPTHIKDLKIAGFNVTNVKKGQGSVLMGINFLKSCDIIVNKECVNFLKEIRSYSWRKNPNGGFMYGVLAEGQKDHLMDSLRYALEKEITKDYMKSSIASVF